MKKLVLLVAVFLVGTATQANVKSLETLQSPLGNYDRYLSSQSISFFEGGVLYEVFLDGSFTYSLPNATVNYRTSRSGTNARRAAGSSNGRRVHPGRVFIDRYGILHAIGHTQIVYKQNGKVRKIGSVKLVYINGRLVQAGNMDVFYNRRGRVSHTLGNINRRNIITGVCGVTPGVHYQNYHRGNRRIVQTRYTGLGSTQDYQYDDWNTNNDRYNANDRTGRRSRH